MEHVRILEKRVSHDLKISLKTHDVPMTLAAYRLMSETCDYPLHLDSPRPEQLIRCHQIGCRYRRMLAEGIGDAFRISLTAAIPLWRLRWLMKY